MSHYNFCLHNRLHPESSTYNIPAVFRIKGDLNRVALRKSVEAVMKRHDAFKISFPHHNEPLQPSFFPEGLYSYTEIDAEIQEDRLSDCLNEEIVKPFDLDAGPLIRFRLYKIGADEALLLLVMHHSIMDLRSKELLGAEISAQYNMLVTTGQLGTTADTSGQFTDYLTFMQSWLSGPESQKMRDFWKQELQASQGLIQLPLDHPRPPVASHQGKALYFDLDVAQSDTFLQACRARFMAPYLVLLASYLVVLSRFTQQETIVIGVPLSNRRREADKDTIGCYVNILPLSFELSEAMTLEQALGLVRKKMLQAHRNQELPFHEIVAAVQAKRELSYNPIFQVGFTYEPPMELHLHGVMVRSEKWHNHGAQMDLFLNIFDMSERIQGYFEYNCSLFDPETIERLSRCYQRLLMSWQDTVDVPVGKIEILSSTEKEKLFQGWNDTQVDYGPDKCLLEAFEEIAIRKPDHPALVFGEETLTYSEVNQRANQVANYLVSSGYGGADKVIAVCLERSVEMVIALYAVLKAGAAYLPIEPEIPEQRRAYILEESKADVVLTQTHVQDRLKNFSGRLLVLDDKALFAGLSKKSPQVESSPTDLAYVIYTSGSTGKPKGVMIEHRGIYNRLMWMQATYPLHEQDRVLQKTPFGFDVSVWEFFWPLMVGACLVIPPPEAHKNPVKLCKIVRDSAITTLHFVPSMLRLFLETEEAKSCSSLQRVFCSGEALSWSLRNDFFNELPACQLHNLYGPTEASVDVTFWDCKSALYPGKVPIGYPVGNTKLYILDKYLQPVPAGVIGDLYISGIQVARGYLNREELTRERFIPDPFFSQERMYKTGDLARYLRDGAIEYCGRSDFQVKLLGNRIELTEIEAALRIHSAIEDAVVMLTGTEAGAPKLAAYILTQVGDSEALNLQKFLMELLPYYMVPSLYILMKEFPLTSSGKINRKALPEASDFSREKEKTVADFSGTTVDCLSVISKLWMGILDEDDIDIESNFFDAGGTSLQVTQLAHEIEKELEIKLSVVKVFQYPTVEKLAKFIEKKVNK